MPLASAGQLPLFAGAEETLAAVSSPQFDPRGSVFLPLEARGVITVTNRSAARITRSVFSDQDVQLAVQADQPAIVVVAQTFYHNWRATVDGAPAKLWESNSAFQALEVSAGNHQIRLTYYDRMFKLGRIISLGSLALCLSLWFLRTKEQKT
jgi:uncharacterized membrane protein YfhO